MQAPRPQDIQSARPDGRHPPLARHRHGQPGSDTSSRCCTAAGLIEVVKRLGDRLECLEINRPLFVGTASDSWGFYLDDASRHSRYRSRSRHRPARAKCVTAVAAKVYCPTPMPLVAEQRALLVDAARDFCPRLVHLRILPEINKARWDSGFSASSRSSSGGGGSLVSGSSTDIASLVLYK